MDSNNLLICRTVCICDSVNASLPSSVAICPSKLNTDRCTICRRRWGFGITDGSCTSVDGWRMPCVWALVIILTSTLTTNPRPATPERHQSGSKHQCMSLVEPFSSREVFNYLVIPKTILISLWECIDQRILIVRIQLTTNFLWQLLSPVSNSYPKCFQTMDCKQMSNHQIRFQTVTG